jgi:hypothetical protein
LAVPSTYLTKAESARDILDAIQRAGVPERFSHDFLQKQLGFTSSSDRPIIPMLKVLGFIDDANVPTDRYRSYRDPSESKRVMAEAMRSAYADIFAADQRADLLSAAKLNGIFARVSGKGDSVTRKMASTFKVLVDLADFDALPGERVSTADSDEATGERKEVSVDTGQAAISTAGVNNAAGGGPVLHHDVHVHLPVSTDIAVYDAIFRSLKEHLAS